MPLILSGGLDAGNVGAAIATVHPYAVDTASGTEAAPGRKDPDKLRAFFDAVARTAAPATPGPAQAEPATAGAPQQAEPAEAEAAPSDLAGATATAAIGEDGP